MIREKLWRVQLRDGMYYNMMNDKEIKKLLYKLQKEKADVIKIEQYDELISLYDICPLCNEVIDGSKAHGSWCK